MSGSSVINVNHRLRNRLSLCDANSRYLYDIMLARTNEKIMNEQASQIHLYLFISVVVHGAERMLCWQRHCSVGFDESRRWKCSVMNPACSWLIVDDVHHCNTLHFITAGPRQLPS